ncbi:MAG: hypothetical protein G8345_17775 [Magnetococcales bacterium]|nr:hypothetical protein [Magnetococcales bacterium]
MHHDPIPKTPLPPVVEAKLREKMAALQQDFALRLPGMLNDLAQRFHTLASNPWNPQHCLEFYQKVHALAGSAGTFGFIQCGNKVRQLEDLLRQHGLSPNMDCSTPPDATTLQSIQQLVQQLSEMKNF